MKRRFGYLLIAAVAISAVLATSASAFVADPTDTSTWRLENIQDATGTDYVSRTGTHVTAANWMEDVYRWGDEPISSSTYNGLPTAQKNMVDVIRDPVTGNYVPRMATWNATETAVQSKVEAGTATALQREVTTGLWKSRAALSVAPRLLEIGSVVLTAGTALDLSMKFTTMAENKLMGWHINLRGPFGIFGGWNPDPPQSAGGTDLRSQTITGMKWVTGWQSNVTTGHVQTSCQPYDILMQADTGSPYPCDTSAGGTGEMWMMIINHQDTNSAGVNITSTPVSQVEDVPFCDSVGWTSAFPAGSQCGQYDAYQEAAMRAMYNTMKASVDAGWGMWIHARNTGGDASGPVRAVLQVAMTPAGMLHFFDGAHSWAYQRAQQAGDTTQMQGDAAQPSSTFTATKSPIAGPLTDAGMDTVQKAARDGSATQNASNQNDCAVSGIPQAGVACPDPMADGFLVPDTCVGALVAVCISELQSAGFDGNHVDTTLGRDSADLTKPAGAVVTIDPAGGAYTTADDTFALTVNPDPLPIEIPQRVNGNETASDWEARLRASGYTGTITEVTLTDTTADGTVGPGVETFPITDTTTGETRSPGDRIEPGDGLTIYKNPDTVPPVATSTPGCNCPPIDFTPLTSLGLGSKFPFGIFTYAAGIIGDFNVTPQAPDFALTAQATGIDGNNLNAPYDVNLGDVALNRVGTPLNTYMSYWRDLLSFCMWVGAIFFVGRKLLGYEGGGDPGEAVDEIL